MCRFRQVKLRKPHKANLQNVSGNILRTFIFILIILLDINIADSQCSFRAPTKLPADIQTVCDSLSKSPQVESDRLGYGGSPSDIYPYYEKLKTLASEEILLRLTNYPNSIVRCYSFWALKDKKVKKDKLLKIVYAHLCDTETVTSQSGCLVHTTTVGDFMLDNIHYDEFYKLTEKENKKLDSLLFWVPNNGINQRKHVVKITSINKTNYNRLKTLLLKEGVDEALLPLLAAKNKSDLSLITEVIKKNPDRAFEAIAKYPIEQFQMPLRTWQKTGTDLFDMTWLNFYKAVIAYNNSFAIETLQIPLQGRVSDTAEQHASNIYWNLKDNNNKIFDSVRISTLNYLSNMEESYFKTLWKIDSIQCIKIIERRLTTEPHPFWEEKLLEIMATKIISHEKENSVNIINKILTIGYSSTFIAFSKKANKIYNLETIEAYKKRFLADENAEESGLDYGIDGILAFDNQTLYKEIEVKAFAYAQLEKFKNSRSLPKLLSKINPTKAKELQK
jgi:hypothetical protein